MIVKQKLSASFNYQLDCLGCSSEAALLELISSTFRANPERKEILNIYRAKWLVFRAIAVTKNLNLIIKTCVSFGLLAFGNSMELFSLTCFLFFLQMKLIDIL